MNEHFSPDVGCPECGSDVARVVWAVAGADGVEFLPGQGDQPLDAVSSYWQLDEFGCPVCGWHGTPSARDLRSLLTLLYVGDLDELRNDVCDRLSCEAVLLADGKPVRLVGETCVNGRFGVLLVDYRRAVDIEFPITEGDFWLRLEDFEEVVREEADAALEVLEREVLGDSHPAPAVDLFGISAESIRVPGAAGAAVILTPVLAVAEVEGTAAIEQSTDITVLEPSRFACYRGRRLAEGELASLHEFLRSAMVDDYPEGSAPIFSSASAGLRLSVPSSSEDEVDLEVSIVMFQDETPAEFEQMRYTVDRAALYEPVAVARRLAGIPDAPPSDFSFLEA